MTMSTEMGLQLKVPQPNEPPTSPAPNEPAVPIDPDPGTPADPSKPAEVPAVDEPPTPIVPDPAREPPIRNRILIRIPCAGTSSYEFC